MRVKRRPVDGNPTVLIVGRKSVEKEIAPVLNAMDYKAISTKDLREMDRQLEKPNIKLVIFDDNAYPDPSPLRYEIPRRIHANHKKFIFLSSNGDFIKMMFAKNAGAMDYIHRPFSQRELALRIAAVLELKKRITCLGGGTGLFHLLQGIKSIPNTHVTSVVSMADDGGSTGILRSEFGILAPGDVRRSLVALSNAPELMNQLMTYRFEKGKGLAGHNLGNLLLTALSEIHSSMGDAVKSLGDILHIQGIVVPVTRQRSTIMARFENGKVVKSETAIDTCQNRSPDLRITRLWHNTNPQADVNALCALLWSDLVLIGPGDLYTSVIVNLLVADITKAIANSGAKCIYISNLMSKPGETSGLDAYDYVREISRYLGNNDLDFVLLSNTPISRAAAGQYRKKNQYPVSIKRLGALKKYTGARVIEADISHAAELVRHDPVKLKKVIQRILQQQV